MLFFCRWLSSVASPPKIYLTLRQAASCVATWSCCPCSSWFSPGWSAGSCMLVSATIVARAHLTTDILVDFIIYLTSCWSHSFYSRWGGMCGPGRMWEILWCQCGLHQHRLSKTGGGSHAQRWVAKGLCLLSWECKWQPPFTKLSCPILICYLIYCRSTRSHAVGDAGLSDELTHFHLQQCQHSLHNGHLH